jgi:hypothetical protein
MSSSVGMEFLYRVAAPILFVPWILTQFFAASFAWFFLALWALWTWNTTFYYIPMFSMAIFVVTSPLQVNQRIIISIIERIASYIDTFIDDILFPIVESFFYFISPACWSHNFLWDAAVALFRIGIWNPIKGAVTSAIPSNPFQIIQDVQIQAGSFPITTIIDTSSSPDWIVGPYDRDAKIPSHARHLVNGTRFVDPSDPASRKLIEWIRHRRGARSEGRGRKAHPHRVPLTLYLNELDVWTHPETPAYLRQSTSERILRRIIDREIGLEKPGWWEPEPNADPEPMVVKGGALPDWILHSEWGEVFDHPLERIEWGGVGVVELDQIPDLPDYAKHKQALRVFPGSKAYRFLANDRGERFLPIPEMQVVAQIFSILFDNVANIILQAVQILYRIALFVARNIRTGFTSAIEVMANFLTRFFREFLNLQCMEFTSVEDFAISLLDCICAPLRFAIQSTAGAWANDYWNYKRPQTVAELPQAILSCIGLGCIDVDQIVGDGSFIGGANALLVQFLGNCLKLNNNVICCFMNPLGCVGDLILHHLPCRCINRGWNNVQPPQCAWPSPIAGNVARCLVYGLAALLGCNNRNACPSPGILIPFDLAEFLLECLAKKLADLDFFIDLLTSLLPFRLLGGGGGGNLFPSVSVSFRRDMNGPAPDYYEPPTSQELLYLYGKNFPTTDDHYYYPHQQQFGDSTIEEAMGGSGRIPEGPEANAHQYDYRDYLTDYYYYYHNAQGHRDANSSSSSSQDKEALARGIAIRKNFTIRSKDLAGAQREIQVALEDGTLVPEEYFGKDYKPSAIAKAMQDYIVAQNLDIDTADRVALIEARFRQRDGEDPLDDDDGENHRRKGSSSIGDLLSWKGLLSRAAGAAVDRDGVWADLLATMEKESPERQRARLRAQLDRMLFRNPYIRITAGRFTSILWDMLDYGEKELYGPDPFARRPVDAAPLDEKDIRTRYPDHSMLQSEAYMMHAQAVLDNPYYAGLYKVLFQVGGRDNEGYNEVMDALADNKDNSLFHYGRMISASRQIYSSLGWVLEEVWWDPDTFSFHFPVYSQIHEIMVRSHLPLYLDDARSAAADWMRCTAAEAEVELNHEAMRYAMESDRMDPETAARNHPMEVHGYSWFVQAEVVLRTAGIRLLSPRHLQPMLEKVAERSPIHAHYAHRMSERVEALRDVSSHYRTTFENDLELMFEQLLSEHQGEMERESHERRASGYLGEDSSMFMHLDPDRHPDLGNRSLGAGERVTFEDGRTGVFLGTQARLARLFTDRMSPTRSTFDERGEEVGTPWLQSREATIVIIVKGVILTFKLLWRYRRFIITGLVAIITTPWGRVFWETWFHFFWVRIVRPLYSNGLQDLFGNIIDILSLIADFAILNTTIVLFLVNEMLRYVLCFLWVFIMAGILAPIILLATLILPGPGPIIVMVLGAGVVAAFFVVPICPPEQVIVNNRMQQSPLQYIDAIFKCFGDIDVNDIPDQFGKGVYNGICHVPQDCPGNAPCVCENKGGQLSSILIEFVDNTPCGTEQAPTGQCLCYPKINCEWLLPRLGLADFFDQDCRDYGYTLDNVVWYQTSSWFLIFWNAHNNFWISLRYATRTLTRAPGIPPLLFPVLISVGVIVLIAVQLYTGAIVIALVAGFEYGLPLWRRFTIDVTLPALRTAINTGIPLVGPLADWIAGFLRFPNHTTGSPLGHMRSGEGICFIFNIGTMFGGAAVTFFFWGLLILLLWYGMGPILWLFYNLFMTPVRTLYAPVWLYLQQSGGQEAVEAFKDRVRRFIPGAARAMDIGNDFWAYSRPYREAMIPREPNTPLNRWLRNLAPSVNAEFKRQQAPNWGAAPIIIQGAMPGVGGGTLDHDLFYGTQPYAGDSRRATNSHQYAAGPGGVRQRPRGAAVTGVYDVMREQPQDQESAGPVPPRQQRDARGKYGGMGKKHT